MEDDLRIGRIPGVVVPESTADAKDSRRKGRFAQKPTGNVHLMNSLVAEIAGARVEVPMPIVMRIARSLRVASRSIERLVRRWAEPKIAINCAGKRERRIAFTN